MSSFMKTCLSETLLLAALAFPIVLAGGCENQSDPPVEPRAAIGSANAAEPSAPAGEPQPAAADGTITARVKTALMADEQVKGLRIDVDTRNAEVTLKGALDTDEQVARAVEVAKGVDGVRDVINRLTVKGEDKAANADKG